MSQSHARLSSCLSVMYKFYMYLVHKVNIYKLVNNLSYLTQIFINLCLAIDSKIFTTYFNKLTVHISKHFNGFMILTDVRKSKV